MHSSCRVSNLSKMLKLYRCLLENVQIKLWNIVNQIDALELGFAELEVVRKFHILISSFTLIGKEV